MPFLAPRCGATLHAPTVRVYGVKTSIHVQSSAPIPTVHACARVRTHMAEHGTSHRTAKSLGKQSRCVMHRAAPHIATAHHPRLHALGPRTAGDESAAARQLRRLWPPPLPSSRRDDQQQPTAASRPTT